MKRLICILAFCHLMLVGLTIAHNTDKWLHRGPWAKPLMFYGGVSYAIWRFGFFAPDVGKSTEAEIKIYDDAGKSRYYSTLDGFRFFVSTLDASNRFYAFKMLCGSDPAMQDLCARSVATRMMNLHPGGSRVDYTLRTIRYPAMDEYRKGAPISKVELYSTTFALRGRTGKAKTPTIPEENHVL